MPIVRLKYPAYPKDASDDRGINQRVSEAHVHDNMAIIDDITQDDIDRLRVSVNVDLSNLSDKGVAKIKELNDAAGYITKAGVETSKNYLYTIDGWKDISTIDVASVSAASSNITVSKAAPNTFKIDLSSDNKSEIAKIANKYDKLVDAVTSNIVLFGTSGTLKDSGMNLEMLQLKSNMSDSTTSEDPNTYASSKAVKAVNDKLDKAIAGIGKLRGAVYNAFASTGISYTITEFAIKSGGTGGYMLGDKFGIVGAVDAELTVTGVSADGVVTALEINNGGAFTDTTVTEFIAYPRSAKLVSIEDATNTVEVQNVKYKAVSNTTLRTIEDPLIGDTCYVNFDEIHDQERSLYTYKALNDVTNGWVYTSCVAAYPVVKVCEYV